MISDQRAATIPRRATDRTRGRARCNESGGNAPPTTVVRAEFAESRIAMQKNRENYTCLGEGFIVVWVCVTVAAVSFVKLPIPLTQVNERDRIDVSGIASQPHSVALGNERGILIDVDADLIK